MILALVYPIVLGLDRLEAASFLRSNGIFRYLTGLPQFPDPTTLRRYLHQAGPDLREQLRRLNDRLAANCSNTRIPAHGSSWTWTPPCCRSTGGTTPPSGPTIPNGAARDRTSRSWPSSPPPACSGPARCARAATPGGTRSCRSSTTPGPWPRPPSVSSASGPTTASMDRPAWSGSKRTVRSTPSSRDSPARSATASSGCGTPRSMAAGPAPPPSTGHHLAAQTSDYRDSQGPQRGDPQPTLFTMGRYAYHAYVTNLDLTPERVWRFYNDRARIELIIKELKYDYALGQLPTRRFEANALRFEILRLAYNLVVGFQTLCLPASWASATLSTIRQHFFLLPALLARPQGRPALRFPRHLPAKRDIEAVLERLRALERRPLW